MRKGRSSVSSSPVRQCSAPTTRPAAQRCHVAAASSTPSSGASLDSKLGSSGLQVAWCSGQGSMPGQLQSHATPTTPRGVGARTNPNTVVSSRAGCSIVCQRGVGSRFAPRPVRPCVRSPSIEDSVSKDIFARDTQAVEVPRTSTTKHSEVYSPAAPQGRPCMRKSRSLSSKGARYDSAAPSRNSSPRKQREPCGHQQPSTPGRTPRSVRWEDSVPQEMLESRVHMLEQKIRELSMHSMSKFEDKPARQRDREHLLQSSPMRTPSFDELDIVEPNAPSLQRHQDKGGSLATKQEKSKTVYPSESYPAESPIDRSLECSPASPAPSCMIASPDGRIVCPLQNFAPTGSSSHQRFQSEELQANDENSNPAGVELAAELEILKAQVANLSLELTECKQSKYQVEKTFRETTKEYQKSMKTLLGQLEKVAGNKVSGQPAQKRPSSNRVRTPR